MWSAIDRLKPQGNEEKVMKFSTLNNYRFLALALALFNQSQSLKKHNRVIELFLVFCIFPERISQNSEFLDWFSQF